MLKSKSARHVDGLTRVGPLVGSILQHKAAAMEADSSPDTSASMALVSTGQRQSCSVFALVGCQRTGTHFLREIINSNPSIATLAEVFSQYPQSVYWHNFVRSLPADRYPPCYPANATKMLDEYISVIRENVDENSDWYGGPKLAQTRVGLDIKYNQLKSIAVLYSDLRSGPFLLDYFRSRSVRIIHMVRQNLVHTAISLIIADTRSVWQNYDRATIQGQYRIPPEKLFSYIDWIKQERAEFEELAQGMPLLVCTYEELVREVDRVAPGQELPQDTPTLRRLSVFLDVPNYFRRSDRISKVINRPYAEIIENYDDLIRAIRDSEYWETAQTL